MGEGLEGKSATRYVLARMIHNDCDEITEWCTTGARSEICVTCEPLPCQSRFPRQPCPSRLNQGLEIAAEVFMSNTGSYPPLGAELRADTSTRPRCLEMSLDWQAEPVAAS
jgi:hypothetical protein